MEETKVVHKKKATMAEALEATRSKVVAPKLRFKGFNESWENAKLGDVGKIRMCKRIFSHETKEIGEIPFYKIGTFGKEPDAFITNELYLNFKERFSFPKVGDILMSASGTLGRTVVYDGRPAYFQDSNIVWLDNDEKFITNSFLYYIYQIVKYNSEGGTIQRLYNSIISNTKFTKPSLLEQQKIASFLSAVDEKIKLLKRKKKLLEQYKKGVMQQLFSGQLRFKDEKGKLYPKWDNKKLGQVGEIVSGLTYSPNDIHQDGILVLRSSNVQDRRLSFEDNVYVNVSEGNFNPVKENDILICVRNGSKNLIGKNAIIDKKNAGVAFGAFMTVFRSDYNLFLFHYFDTDMYKNEVHKNLGATINSINGSDLKKFKIPFPSEPEQKKIADFLSAIDVKIESLSNQINQTQNFKKGLLQQMFV